MVLWFLTVLGKEKQVRTGRNPRKLGAQEACPRAAG